MSKMLDGIMGLVVGDALGVPVEFCERMELKVNPVDDMLEYGTHSQPRGTWSDDSSLALATLDGINHGYDLNDIASRLYAWHSEGEYTPHGEVFDEGITSYDALKRFGKGRDPRRSGMIGEYDNGNGSLMRILPVCLYAIESGCDDTDATMMVHEVGGITHAHPISKIACGIYYFCAKQLVNCPTAALNENLSSGIKAAHDYYSNVDIFKSFMNRFSRLDSISCLEEDEISSAGYVVATLEAALWCLSTTESYRDCVLKAVNLGEDTDTTAAVAGGLAGLYYGIDGIPQEWLQAIARREWIEELCNADRD